MDYYLHLVLLGGYDTLLGLIKYPYDSLIVLFILIFSQVISIINSLKPIRKYNELKSLFYHKNFLKFNIIEYLLISLIAILAFVFVGSFINGLKALSNILYDIKYVYLLLWVLLPIVNLLFLVFKFENKDITKKKKVILLSSNITINIIFGLLLLVFELIYPSFIVHISKPLFTIAFSVSLPIEMLVLLIIMLISIIVNSVKLFLVVKNN